MINIYKKTVVVILIFVFLFSPIFAVPARAQWIVFDPANFETNLSEQIKDYGLDSLAWIIVNIIIERIAASTVNWINSGFEGKPAYVTDPESYFTDMADQMAGRFIFSDPKLNFLCGPISAKIRLTLQSNYIRDNERWRCTLTDAVGNMEDFMGDFDRGGWDKFFELSQKQQNNPIGAYIQAENELNMQIATKQGVAQSELNWGSGFMSKKECVHYSGGGTGPCDEWGETETPGSVIQNQLDKVLSSGSDRLQVADEINEIVSALLNQLISGVIGGIGRGLRGLSSGSSSNNNQSLTEQLATSTAAGTVDYFGNSQDTSILDVPIPNPASGTGGTSVTPIDNDCATLDPDQLLIMAQNIANQLGITFEQAMLNLDCDPAGIH